jgi:hypothetical protein
MVQDSIRAIANEHRMPLDAIRDAVDRMIEDENSPIEGTEGYDDDFDAANQWDM